MEPSKPRTGFTRPSANININAHLDESKPKENKKMAKAKAVDKRTLPNPKAMAALKNACPLSDFIIAYHTGVVSERDSEWVAAYIGKLGYSASPDGVIARARRIRKGSKTRKSIHLGLLVDERATKGLAVNEEELNEMLAGGAEGLAMLIAATPGYEAPK
jgi:hypothetical protein